MIVPCPKADFQVLSWFLVVYLCPTNTSWVVSTHPSIWKIWVKSQNGNLAHFGVKIKKICELPPSRILCHYHDFKKKEIILSSSATCWDPASPLSAWKISPGHVERPLSPNRWDDNSKHLENQQRLIQGGPVPVRNGVITPYRWPYKWVTAIIPLLTVLKGVLTPVTTGIGRTHEPKISQC